MQISSIFSQIFGATRHFCYGIPNPSNLGTVGRFQAKWVRASLGSCQHSQHHVKLYIRLVFDVLNQESFYMSSGHLELTFHLVNGECHEVLRHCMGRVMKFRTFEWGGLRKTGLFTARISEPPLWSK